MLGHKTSFSTFKKTDIVSSIFSAHNGMKPEVSYRGKLKNTQIREGLITCY